MKNIREAVSTDILKEKEHHMSNTVIASPLAPAAVGPYSQAIKAGNFIHVSGQLPIDSATGEFPEGGIEAQTR